MGFIAIMPPNNGLHPVAYQPDYQSRAPATMRLVGVGLVGPAVDEAEALGAVIRS